MKYWLCLNFLPLVEGTIVADFLDRLPVPWEWHDLTNCSECKLIVIRCEDAEEIETRMRTLVDRKIMTAFGFWQPEAFEVMDQEVGSGI